MATSPAIATDLSNRSLRTLSGQEVTVGGVLLADAFNILVQRVPSVATRLDAVTVDAVFRALVVQIECAMVLRVLNNPDGKLEEHGDDYGYRRDAALSTGALYLSDAEADLLGIGDSVSSGAFTIRPYGSAAVPPSTWYSVGSASI